MVSVKHGTDQEDLELAGSTVQEARNQISTLWNVSSEATALVNGKEVPEDTVLTDGAKLEFVKSESKFVQAFVN